jgi:glycosyltransferase involved in cell wall biosynthesis
MDLSIIVPVYNVEKYVKPCIESIFKQGLDESRFEVIIVNDGSTDKSMDTISDIIQAHDNITVIHQRAERNEVMDYLKELAPDLNFTHGIRQCATTFMFRHMPHLFINAYYYYAKYAYKHGKD